MILSVGEALAEFMRTRPGVPLDRTGEFAGPFPGGAPAIFASVAARRGGRSALCSVVGDDPFGVLLRRRLESDGVDVSGLRTDRGATTACAFVSYDERGERTFVFHVAQAAAGCLREDNLADLPERASWMHVSGATIALSQAMANVVDVACRQSRRAKSTPRAQATPSRPRLSLPRLREPSRSRPRGKRRGWPLRRSSTSAEWRLR